MRTLKNNKELQASTSNKFIDEDVKEKNARGKKLAWLKSKLKAAARHLRHEHKKINIDE